MRFDFFGGVIPSLAQFGSDRGGVDLGYALDSVRDPSLRLESGCARRPNRRIVEPHRC